MVSENTFTPEAQHFSPVNVLMVIMDRWQGDIINRTITEADRQRGYMSVSLIESMQTKLISENPSPSKDSSHANSQKHMSNTGEHVSRRNDVVVN